ncbi:MAG: hypothetical protein ABSG82_00735 [Sedimentisphaerales bacterium]|jgi:hypothetical protein
MSKSCSQCGKSPAIYQIADHLLCLDCAYKAEQINEIKLTQCMRDINWLMGQMEVATGLPGLCGPRYELPKPPPILNSGNLTFNNINVEKSVIGAVNTGNIGQIDISLSNIKNGGNEELATVLKEFTEAILRSVELTDSLKNEILEHLSFLAGQASLPEPARKKSVIQTLLSTIERVISSIPALIALFDRLKGMFGSL